MNIALVGLGEITPTIIPLQLVSDAFISAEHKQTVQGVDLVANFDFPRGGRGAPIPKDSH